MALGFIALAVVSPPARAQPIGRFLADQYFPAGIPGYGEQLGVTVRSRLHPDYAPLGVHVGDFTIRPQVTQSLGYNDNVIGVGTKSIGSFTSNTDASVGATTTGSAGTFGGQATMSNVQVPNASSQNHTDWTASLGAGINIGRDVLSLGASYLSLHQNPTDINASSAGLPSTFSTEPLPFTIADVRANYATTFGRFTVIPGIAWDRITFSNLKIISLTGAPVPPEQNGIILGLPVSQKYRDRDIITGDVTTRYEIAPLRNALLDVRYYNTNYYTAEAGSFGPARSSNAVEVLAGLDYTADAVWRYRALVGFEYRDFNAPQYKNRAAPIVEADVVWTPTGLTTVTGRVIRSIEDASEENVSGYTYTSAFINVDHEYLRNVIFSGYVGLQNANYLQTNATQTLYQAGLSANWLLNRNMRVGASYAVTDRNVSSGFGQDYLQNVYLVQFHFAL
jgi:hypothetical protein